MWLSLFSPTRLQGAWGRGHARPISCVCPRRPWSENSQWSQSLGERSPVPAPVTEPTSPPRPPPVGATRSLSTLNDGAKAQDGPRLVRGHQRQRGGLALWVHPRSEPQGGSPARGWEAATAGRSCREPQGQRLGAVWSRHVWTGPGENYKAADWERDVGLPVESSVTVPRKHQHGIST